MFLTEESLPSPEENLAWDEAILELADTPTEELCSPSSPTSNLELLRVWEMPKVCVVVGRSSRVDQEVQVDSCRKDGIPILRRMSGGASIVAGPGCFMYSVLLSLDRRPECRALDIAHRTVMEKTREGLQRALAIEGVQLPLGIQGVCDLTVNNRKISGNSLRVKRRWLMYHGTLLIDFPLDAISRYLATPPKQPEYRERRPHEEFVVSLAECIPDRNHFYRLLTQSLSSVWGANQPWTSHPLHGELSTQVELWMERRYRDPNWHLSR